MDTKSGDDYEIRMPRNLHAWALLAVTALDAGKRRYLIDIANTFGGTHFADPRQVYVELRYRFHY